jgi:hypothetical protein
MIIHHCDCPTCKLLEKAMQDIHAEKFDEATAALEKAQTLVCIELDAWHAAIKENFKDNALTSQ